MAVVIAIRQGTSNIYFTDALAPAASLPTDGPVFRWLTSKDPIREVARSPGLVGLGAGESPSYEFRLDNRDGQAFTLLSIPLRSSAQAIVDGETLFDGLIQQVSFGVEYRATIEA